MRTKLYTGIAVLVAAMFLFAMPAQACSITSTEVTTVEPFVKYSYSVTVNNTTVMPVVNTTADWLVVMNEVNSTGFVWTNVTGIPTQDDIGVYYVNITATDFWGTDWQNFTIDVTYAPFNNEIVGAGLIIAIIFCGLLSVLGMVDPRFMFLAGVVWIFSALIVFYDYGVGWAILGVGIGMFLLVRGGMNLDKEQ